MVNSSAQTKLHFLASKGCFTTRDSDLPPRSWTPMPRTERLRRAMLNMPLFWPEFDKMLDVKIKDGRL